MYTLSSGSNIAVCTIKSPSLGYSADCLLKLRKGELLGCRSNRLLYMGSMIFTLFCPTSCRSILESLMASLCNGVSVPSGPNQELDFA